MFTKEEVFKNLQDLSGGELVRLALCKIFKKHPNFLILDEPTAGLDVMARNEMLDMLRDYMEEDEERSIIISSHISSDLETLCDDIYMINDGNIILHKETDNLLSNYAILKVDEEQLKTLDPQYLIRMKKESYGYTCLTDQKQFYLENYPKIVIEKGTIDQIITMMIQGLKEKSLRKNIWHRNTASKNWMRSIRKSSKMVSNQHPPYSLYRKNICEMRLMNALPHPIVLMNSNLSFWNNFRSL